MYRTQVLTVLATERGLVECPDHKVLVRLGIRDGKLEQWRALPVAAKALVAARMGVHLDVDLVLFGWIFAALDFILPTIFIIYSDNVQVLKRECITCTTEGGGHRKDLYF